MPHLYVKIFLTHMKERVALLYMSQSDQEDQEQVAEEPLTEEKKKVREVKLSLETMGLITKLLPSSSQDEEISHWERLLGEWDEHIRNVGPTEVLENAHQVALSGAATAYFERYRRGKKKKDLARAIELWQASLKQAPLDLPDLPGRLNLLGYALNEYYERTANVTHLKQSIQLSEVSSPAWLDSLNSLGNVLRSRYKHTKKVADQDRAIQVYGQLTEHTPLDSPDLPMRMHNLCSGLLERYTRTRDMADLDRDLRAWEETLERTPLDDQYRLMYVGNFANGALMHYTLTDELDDLKRAIKALKLAVNELPPKSQERVGYLEQLYTCMIRNWQITKDLADIDDAIQTGEQVIAKTPADAHDLPVMYNFLMLAYTKRGEKTHDEADWDKSLQIQEQSLAISKPGSFYRMQCSFNLGSMLNARYGSR